MKKNKTTKLGINKETVRALSNAQLTSVAGGLPHSIPYGSCLSDCGGTCNCPTALPTGCPNQCTVSCLFC